MCFLRKCWNPKPKLFNLGMKKHGRKIEEERYQGRGEREGERREMLQSWLVMVVQWRESERVVVVVEGCGGGDWG